MNLYSQVSLHFSIHLEIVFINSLFSYTISVCIHLFYFYFLFSCSGSLLTFLLSLLTPCYFIFVYSSSNNEFVEPFWRCVFSKHTFFFSLVSLICSRPNFRSHILFLFLGNSRPDVNKICGIHSCLLQIFPAVFFLLSSSFLVNFIFIICSIA